MAASDSGMVFGNPCSVDGTALCALDRQAARSHPSLVPFADLASGKTHLSVGGSRKVRSKNRV